MNLSVVRNTYTEWPANKISTLIFSIIARKMCFNMYRMPVILAIITLSINLSVFLSDTIKLTLLNIHIFLKGKFSHMRL